jgi:hypothetical protein
LASKKVKGCILDKEAELFPLARRERQLADRAYFANRIALLVRLKRLRLKPEKVKEAAVVICRCRYFPGGLMR